MAWLDEKRPNKKCPNCGRTWPASHLDTDSGDCISCEDAHHWEEDEEGWPK